MEGRAAVGRVREELVKTCHHPGRILRLRRRKYRRLLAHSFTGNPGPWQPGNESGFTTRTYPSYGDYVRHQQSKPVDYRETDHDDDLCAALADRLRDDGVTAGASALCLGARFGGEVRAFLAVGCFAVGIDLRTAPESKYVLSGDFHDLQFPDACVDFLYTNSLDHAYDIKAVLAEISRVLKSSGRLIVEAPQGASEGNPPGIWEAFYWSTTDDLVALLASHGFELARRVPFTVPWTGQHLCFERSAVIGAVQPSPGAHTSP